MVSVKDEKKKKNGLKPENIYLDESGFASSIRSNQGNDLASFNGKANVLEAVIGLALVFEGNIPKLDLHALLDRAGALFRGIFLKRLLHLGIGEAVGRRDDL